MKGSINYNAEDSYIVFMVTACTPTKLILIGEHSVVYGVPALSMPLPMLTAAKVEQQSSSKIKLTASEEFSPLAEQNIREGIHLIQKELGKEEDTNLNIHITLTAPAGVGLGVSASVSVALIRVLYEFYNVQLSQEKLFELAEALEKTHHGNPSGIDHTTIILQQPIYFQKQKQGFFFTPVEMKKEQNFFKDCYLINTGTPKESTKEMVEFVADQYERDPKRLKILFQKIEIMAPLMKASIEEGDKETFRDILNQAGIILEELGIVSPRVKKISAEIRAHGGMVKVSGAGGRSGNGSGILLVHHPEKSMIEDICKKYTVGAKDFLPLQFPFTQ